MKLSWLIFYGLTVLQITILYLPNNTEVIAMVTDLLKILISGYLGYLIKSIES